MEKRKELLKIMLKKYNKQKIKVVDKIDSNFAGSLCNGDIKIVFDVDKDFLIIQDNITIDNIHLYYEFMSDEDLPLHHRTIRNVFYDRKNLILKYLYLTNSLNNEKLIQFIYHKYTQSFFGIKDILKPIDEYIAEIKDSEGYGEYLAKKA